MTPEPQAAGFFPVTPRSPRAAREPQATPSNLDIRQGQYFAYALPPGWRVGEDGQFAVTLLAPDQRALMIMVGNSGLAPNYPPGRYVYERLLALNPQGLQLGSPQPAQPATGFQNAYAFPVQYAVDGVPAQGLAICHVYAYYGGAVMAMTAALSEARQWPGYSSWLPLVAAQISATNGGAFGIRGMMAQNLRNSRELGVAAQRYREYSQDLWQRTTAERDATVDRQNKDFRDNLGGVRSYANPTEPNVPLELSTQYSHYWIDQQGQVVGTNDPSANPNAGSTGTWSRLEPERR